MTNKESKIIRKYNPKGLYYDIIMDKIIEAKRLNERVVNISFHYMYAEQIKGIYAILKEYRKNIDKQEFIFSMEWVLADCFGDGTEVDIPDGAFDFIKE